MYWARPNLALKADEEEKKGSARILLLVSVIYLISVCEIRVNCLITLEYWENNCFAENDISDHWQVVKSGLP